MNDYIKYGELPNGWALSTLGEVCTKPQYGWTTKANFGAGSIKLLRTSDITTGQIDWEGVPYCTTNPPDAEKYLIEPGDILISRAGSIGMSHLVTSTEKAVFASYLIRFRPREAFNKKYIFYFLESPAYWKAVSTSKVGIAVPNVNATKLANIKIPIAPQDEQDRIVAEIEKQFSRLDEAVENLKRVKANLKRYKATVLKAAVEGKLTEKWRAENPDVELPDNWTWASLLSLSQIVVDCHNKTAPYESGGIPLVRTSNVRDGKFDLQGVRYVSQKTYAY